MFHLRNRVIGVRPNYAWWTTHNQQRYLARRALSNVIDPDKPDLVDDLRAKLKERSDKSNEKRIKRVGAIVDKVSIYVDSSDNTKIKPIKGKSLNFYQQFKSFIGQYGYIGVANYWAIWGATFTGSYMSFKYGLIDYTSWDWLHLKDNNNKIIKFIDDNLGMDAVAALLFSKITKPVQWVYIYYTTPPLAKYIRKTNTYKRLYNIEDEEPSDKDSQDR